MQISPLVPDSIIHNTKVCRAKVNGHQTLRTPSQIPLQTPIPSLAFYLPSPVTSNLTFPDPHNYPQPHRLPHRHRRRHPRSRVLPRLPILPRLHAPHHAPHLHLPRAPHRTFRVRQFAVLHLWRSTLDWWDSGWP
jgi:hypothetical protein